MPVTPSGMTTVPTQLVLPVTTLLMIVKVPLVPQLTAPSATACADVGITVRSAAVTANTKEISRVRKWMITFKFISPQGLR